ncbi:TolC family protein [Thalassospira marina]|uniref:Transporter n=1 Tax=Thalassospira marina TaxID=2048283 RepID=A0A2N3KYL1_9PROT|nr:TolC family protein [Thalassospira marina]PKR55652.1 transporter [Thalassospira marina]
MLGLLKLPSKKAPTTVLLAMLLSGCAVVTEPLTIGERQKLMIDTMKAVQEQELEPNQVVTLHEAMARALIYNFETRLDALEEDISKDRIAAGYWDFLPQAIASAGVSRRSNVQASNSYSVTTGRESLETSSSSDQTRETADLRFAWNVLDFGVNYYTVKQTANQSLMAQERHKRVVRELLQDVRAAYWRAVASERLLVDVTQMLERVNTAIVTADRIQNDRLQNPLDILSYKRELYDKLLQLRTIRKGLLQSKMELAKLMNIVPSTNYRLEVPEESPEPVTDIGASPDNLALIALQSRPEIIEAGYNQRIAALEIKKSIARMFPGIEFSTSLNFDSNQYLLNQSWNEVGLKVSWNLLNFLRGNSEVEMAEKQEKVSLLRRQTLGMAVMAQVNIAFLDYEEAVTTYSTTNSLAEINEQIETIQRNQGGSRNLGELQLIKLELDSLVAKLRRDEQYAQVQNAMGRLMYSSGVNIYNDLPSTREVGVLTAALQDAEDAWVRNGMFKRQYFTQISQDEDSTVDATLPGDRTDDLAQTEKAAMNSEDDAAAAAIVSSVPTTPDL